MHALQAPSPVLLQVSGTVTFVRNENMSYPACQLLYSGKTCQKKCTENGGDWCVVPATWPDHMPTCLQLFPVQMRMGS